MRCIIFVAASALLAAPAQAATFARNGDRLTITGSIGEADAIVFEIQLNDRVRTIELNSSGGYLDEAMAIGRSIRERRLDTVIPAGAICESACALIWSAGWRRTANGHLAMHCAVAAAVPYQCDQAARVRMVAYLAEMHAPSVMLEYQQAAGSSSVLYVEPEKLLVADEGVIEEPPPPPRRLPPPVYRPLYPPPPPPPGWLYGPDGRLIPCALGLFGICI
jgi:hypothetical protein